MKQMTPKTNNARKPAEQTMTLGRPDAPIIDELWKHLPTVQSGLALSAAAQVTSLAAEAWPRVRK